jgi:TonB-linked SusC/RagA family outer membrane protein
MTHVRRGWWLSAAFAAAALLGGVRVAMAQDAVVRGRVTSDRGEPIAAANVIIEELRASVTTGADGRYTLFVPAARVRGQDVVLRVRAIGFKPNSKALKLLPGEQAVDVTLPYDVNLLEAVVVTGVQQATEAAKVPFAVGRVDASQLPVPAANPLSQIQGKVAGAQITGFSGRPGTSPAVLLRGPTSINATGRGQEPLYIVDGVIVNGGLPDINPEDIETYEVLKGAAAASLYGSRAGNGVISITTKSGRRALEGVNFHVRTESGVNDIERDFGLAHYQALLMDENNQQFCAFVSGQPTCARTFNYAYEQFRINNDPGPFALSPPSFPVDPGATIAGNVLRERFQNAPWPGQFYNPVRQTVTNQLYNESSIDVTGRFGSTQFYTSGSNLTQQGAIRFLKGYQRNTFRLNVDQGVGTNWNIALRTQYTRSTQDGQDQVSNNTAFFQLTRVPGIVNVMQRDTLGRLYIRPNLQQGGSQNANPLYSLQNNQLSSGTNRFLGGLTLQYNPVTWANFEANFSYDMRDTTALQFQDKGYRTTTSSPGTNNGFLFRAAGNFQSVNGGLNASFKHTFRPDLLGTFNLRYAYEQRKTQAQGASGSFLAVQGVTALSNTRSDTRAIDSFLEDVRQIGLFAGFGVEYKERYIVDALVRRDGSSLFGAANRWATFGRISSAWRVAREPWWFIPQINELKLRATYGTAGRGPQFSAQYQTLTIGAAGPTFSQLGNKNLKPELSKELELGADVEMLNRYGLNVTYARANIDRQILSAPVSASTGFVSQWQNAGSLRNTTWEASLNIPMIQRRELAWSMRFIYDRTRSVITRLDVPSYFDGPPQQGATTMFKIAAGERVGTFYGHYFLRGCQELPAPFSADCGFKGASFQKNSDGFIVWVGTNNTVNDGITKNLWETSMPGCPAACPWGQAVVNWGMPILLRGGSPTNQAAPAIVALGNALPDFHFAVSQDVTWRRFSLYALMDASIGQRVWDEGFHWAHLDFLSKDVDQHGRSVATAKPIGYFWRTSASDNFTGLGGFYDQLGPNNYTVEDASYAKLRELNVSYRLGPINGVGDWNLSVIGRNLFTITGYRGFDPETGRIGGGTATAALNAVDAFSFPNLRTVSFGLSTTF